MASSNNNLDHAIKQACGVLSSRQNDDGHWVFELEADATLPAEYVLLRHFIDDIDVEEEQRIAQYLRRIQGEHGGWPLYHGGGVNISATVKAYYALKIIGDDPNAPHMARARRAVLEHGGAERSNVFTRIQLALFGQLPWHGVPAMPVEIMYLPKNPIFSIWDVSYWSRTVIAPLLVMAACRARAVNPRNVGVQELFLTPPEDIKDWICGPYRSAWGRVFKYLDAVLQPIHRHMPQAIRRPAIRKAVEFVEERLNGMDGLGAIYPAMANVVMMYKALNVPLDTPRFATAWAAVRNLMVIRDDGEAYCQPCVSPIWDTGLSAHAMIETAQGQKGAQAKKSEARLKAAAEWLRNRQILDLKGDWAINAPHLKPGGWAFQYNNDYYPDVDDTAVVGMFLHRTGDPAHAESIEHARRWIVGMQSTNGGWGAFDINNNKDILNHIPFADHGALLDPPTADVTARCVSFLAQLGNPQDRPVIDRAIAYLRSEQEEDGSWFGRWGTNYIYGTWSVLCALNAADVAQDDPMVRRAVAWLLSVQREDGSWGEGEESYEGGPRGRYHQGLPSQTAWALLGLMAAGERHNPAVERGVQWLMAQQTPEGEWNEEPYNAVGFPRVFYLRYHGYRQFFPLMALSRYRNLAQSNAARVQFGF